MYYIGIDLGGTNIAAGVVDEECRIIKKDSVRTNASRGAMAIVADMASLAMRLADETVGRDKIRWVGIGTPGCLDSERTTVVFAGNLPFSMTPVKSMFIKCWDIPVFIGNDANCAALGEAYAGSAVGYRDSVFVTLGTGIGGGIIVNRHIYSGFNCNGGEIGHMGIVVNGEKCTCGRRGCWEAYASVTGLIRITRQAMAGHPESLMWEGRYPSEPHIGGKTAFKAAKAGDTVAKAVVDKYLEYVAFGITNLVNIFQPEIICIGGSISREGDYLLIPVRKIVERDRFTRAVPQTKIHIAALGPDAGIVGAAMLGK